MTRHCIAMSFVLAHVTVTDDILLALCRKQADTMRFFFYGQSPADSALGGTHLVQCTLHKATRRYELVIKSSNSTDISAAYAAIAKTVSHALGAT